jgi:hypothetical protein
VLVVHLQQPGVPMGPGARQFTVMPKGPTSWAR